MFVSTPFTFASPVALAIAACVFSGAVVAATLRRIALPRGAMILLLLGGACAVIAAGEPLWRRPHLSRVLVMVDCSPSTRGAAFRQTVALRQRIAQLLGDTPFDIVSFPGNTPIGDAPSLADVRVEQTHFDPPVSAQAILLFSDGRFDPTPTSTLARIYPVIDPNLESPDDGAVERLAMRGDREVVATFRSRGAARDARISGAATHSTTLPAGEIVVVAPLAPDPADGERDVFAKLLRPSDRWPENDALLMRVPPPDTAERWWVGDSPARPPNGWIAMKPESIPTEPADYLAPAVILLDDVAVDRFLRPQQSRLMQYVRDLGGGLVILGGEHAFAAGGYPGTALEDLSPLASSPPEPSTHWILLADASGSMAASVGDNTKLTFAANAIRAVIPLLPPTDPVSVGSFAKELRWWSRGRKARQLDPAAATTPPFPPADLRPQGPTDLAPALRKIAVAGDGSMPTELLLITDAEASIDDADALADTLARDRIRVHLLGTKDIDASNPVRRIVEKTGGTELREPDPRKWVAALRRLMRTAAPPRIEREPIEVRFIDGASDIPPRQVPFWNRTWLKPLVTELATGEANRQTVPAAAAWNLGEGAVIATAFPTDAATAQALAGRVILAPRDPRWKITSDVAEKLRVTIDAVDGREPLNDLSFRLELFSAQSGGTAAATQPAMFDIPQVSPGRYELATPAPREASIARVRLENRTIDRFAVPARYAPEFDAIGNDRAAMQRLATETGGEVVDPSRTTPLEIRGPRHDLPLRTSFALASAAFVVAGLIRWRMT